jgi:hypothetical protein
MGRNNIPAGAKQLSQLGGKMYTGIVQKGASVPVTMITAAQLQTDLTAFNAAETAFGNARKAVKNAYDVFTPAANDLIEWLNAVRPILISHFGYSWSADWAAAGFVGPSTAIPDKIEDRLGLAASLITFLTANPDFEVAATGVTASHGTAVRDAAVAAQLTVTNTEAALRTAGDTRKPARATLVADMRTLIKNLAAKLAKNDPRWLAFGLEMPATNTTPGKPSGLAAQLDVESGGLILTCDPEPLGRRFRFRIREAGSGLPYQLAASSPHPMALTKPVEAGTTVEIIVQAVNGSAQSVPSDSILFTVPAAAAPGAEVMAPEIVAAAAAAPNGNGSAQTNGTGSLATSRTS